MPPEPTISAKWKWRVVLIVVLLIGVGLWAMMFAYHRIAKARFESYVAELASKGESLDVDDLRPPPIENPDDDVAQAPVFAEFLERCRADPERVADDDSVWNVLKVKLIPGYSQDNVRRDETHVSDFSYYALSRAFESDDERAGADAILAYGNQHSLLLDEIRSALARPKADFRVDYGGSRTSIPEFESFLYASEVLHLQGRAALYVGDNNLARANTLALLRFARHCGCQPTLLNGMLAEVINRWGVSLIHEGLASEKWKSEDLSEFYRELRLRWCESAFLRTVRMDRARTEQNLDQFVEHPEEWAGDDARWIRALFQLPDVRNGWRYDFGWFYCRELQRSILEGEDGVPRNDRIVIPLSGLPEIMPAGISLRDRFRFHLEFFRRGPADMMFRAYTTTRVSALRAQTRNDHARIAISLELHRLRHGSFPATLDALTLPNGDPLPPDPFTGKSYVYRPEGENDYVLYSPGPNGVDEGGLLRFNREDGDWVWRLRLPADFDYEAYRGL